MDAAREDQQQPEASNEFVSSPEKGAGTPTVSVGDKKNDDQGEPTRDPEPDGAGSTIEIRRGGGDREGGEKPGSNGSGENGWWGGGEREFRPAWLVVVTFVHEAWLCLQHANVLLNPLCQRLDRGYGIALVRFSKGFDFFLECFPDFVVGFPESCSHHTLVCVVRACRRLARSTSRTSTPRERSEQ